MQPSRDSVYIPPVEWRWALLFGSVLVFASFIPILWVAFSGAAGDQWQFMGMLSNYRDGATYLAKMLQGYEGFWLITFRHSPETHNPVLVQILYPTLGHLARLLNIPPVAMFHVARAIASLIMYMALYHLGATIWPRRRARRIFFTLVVIGSGLGWFWALVTGQTETPDLAIPEVLPFYSSLVNVHFPLAIACLCLLVSILIVAFRPGMNEDPGVNNGGLVAMFLSFILSLLYPQALVPLGLAVVGYVGIAVFRRRIRLIRELRWFLVILLPALPYAAYLFAIVTYNPAVSEWNRQNVTTAPSIIAFLIGLGVPVLMALPALYRAIREFQQDGDRLVLLWLIAMFVAIYLPTNIQRRFAVGMMIPIAYFATRSLEDFWFQRIGRRWRYRLLVAVIPTLTMSYLLVLLGTMRVDTGPFLERDYAGAFEWLDAHSTSDDVILASPQVSIWIPGWVGARVVYAHPYETLNAEVREQQVLEWFNNTDSLSCEKLFQELSVDYVIVGPQEYAIGQAKCADELHEVYTSETVTIYAP